MTTPHRRAAEEIDADNLDGGTCGDPYVLDETEKTLLKHFPPLVWSREFPGAADEVEKGHYWTRGGPHKEPASVFWFQGHENPYDWKGWQFAGPLPEPEEPE